MPQLHTFEAVTTPISMSISTCRGDSARIAKPLSILTWENRDKSPTHAPLLKPFALGMKIALGGTSD
jgi:hypothetical protein